MMKNALEIRDTLSFFEKAFSLGVQQGRITNEKIQKILEDGAQGIVQIAQHFDTPFLRSGLLSGKSRMVALVSLYLENETQGDFDAAIGLIAHRDFLSLSKGGSEMVKNLGSIQFDSSGSDDERENIHAAYKLFSKPVPWNEGGVLSFYRSQLSERLARREKGLFVKKLAKLSGLDYEFLFPEDIVDSVFLPVVTGGKSNIQIAESLRDGKYAKENWTRLLAQLEDEFPELCHEYSFDNCLRLLTMMNDALQVTETNLILERGEQFEGDGFPEWDTLFPDGEKRGVQQYITAVLTGAILGKMEKQVSLGEFIAICEIARENEMELSGMEKYILNNTPPSLGVFDLLMNRLDRDWRGILKKKSPINKRTYELKLLAQDVNIV